MQIKSLNIFKQIDTIINKSAFQKQKEIRNATISFYGQKSTPQSYCDIKIKEKKEDEFFEKFLNSKGKVTIEEYKKIINHHPSVIIKAQKLIEKENPTQSTPKNIAKAAIALKKRYDEEYKSNYTIVSIGTSPSPITEVMSALGSKVIFIPASGLNTLETNKLYIFRNQYPTISSRNTNIAHIIKYAQINGLTSSNKGFLVLLDYCCSGASLDNLCSIFEEENLFAIDRIHDHSITSDLCEVSNFKIKDSLFKLEDMANISHDMQCSNMEKISNVPHFHIYDQYNKEIKNGISSENKKSKELYKEFKNYSQPLARAFSLCAIHEAIKILESNIS